MVERFRARLNLAGRDLQSLFQIFGGSFSDGSFSVGNEKLPPENHYPPKNFRRKNKQRLNNLKAEMDNRARYCKAARINRVPLIVANIARWLAKNDWLGKRITIIGTNAIYGYESMAAVRVNSALTATKDIDARGKLKLVADDDIEGLLPLLQKVDKSFR